MQEAEVLSDRSWQRDNVQNVISLKVLYHNNFVVLNCY